MAVRTHHVHDRVITGGGLDAVLVADGSPGGTSDEKGQWWPAHKHLHAVSMDDEEGQWWPAQKHLLADTSDEDGQRWPAHKYKHHNFGAI
eukprot:1146314-Pelagomonas_calceolata.AAC.6